ncbi:MAG: histidine kinase [Emticicia sp.]|nr:histidine kinase [Emticicia sp.]
MVFYSSEKQLYKHICSFFKREGNLLCLFNALVLLLSLQIQITFGQDFSYRSLDKTNGMPTNTVYDLLQDKRGFMWFGTDKGLYRYDGSEFRLFSNKKQDGKSLSNLMEDGSGRIWCQNFSGQFFYTEGDSLQFCQQLKPIGSFYQGRILKGRYLFSIGSKNIRIFDIITQQVSQKTLLQLPSPHASNDGLYCYRYSDVLSKIVGFSPNGNRVEISIPKELSAFYHIVDNGKVYFLSKLNATQLYKLENNKITNKVLLSGKGLIQNISLIDEQYLGIYTSSGFYLIDTKSNQKRYFPTLTDKNITSVIKDNEGNFWISTINSGILFVPSLSMKVIEPQLSFTQLRAVETENKLFFGTTKNELFSLNIKTLQKQNLHNGRTNDEVLAIYYDETQKRLLFSSDKFYQMSSQKKTVPVGKYAIKEIEGFDKNTVFVAATGFAGVYDWNPDKKVTQISAGPVRFRAVVMNKTKKELYLATSDGLLKLDSTTQKTEIKYQNETISALDLAIRQNSTSSTIFAATSTKGIYFIENNQVIKHLTKDSGLEDDGIYKIKYYKNQLWWLTEKAIQSYDFGTKSIKTFTKADGLPEADLKDLAFFRDTVYAATLAGLISFPTNQSSKSTFPAKIIINDFESNKKQTQITDNQILKYNQNNIDIHFSVLSYRNIDEIKTYYKINNRPWELLEPNARTLSLPELSPDKYTIQLKAVDADGLESKISSLKFKITPPFWTTFWFWGIIIGVISLISYLLINQNLKRVKREAELQAEKLTLEKDLQVHLLTAIKSQMNQHFMFNTLNGIQEQFLFGDKITASDQLSNFTQLTGKILDVSSKKSIPISTEIEILTKYLDLEKMRFAEGFNYSITLGETIDEDYHQLPPLLIQPFVENAIRHGLLHKSGNKSVEIHFELDANEENILCTVKDNGIGRAKANEINAKRTRQFDSFSTSATKERLRLLSNDLNKQNLITYTDLPEGTEVCITIPI